MNEGNAVLIALLGGTALLLYGVRLVGEGLQRAAGSRLRWACLAHLSEQNNSPDLALRTHREVLVPDFPLHVASRYAVSGIFVV